MAIYQTDYSERMAKGIPGQIANEEKHNHISRTVEDAAGIAFSAPVERGAGDHGVTAFVGGDFMGLAILTPAVPPVAPGGTLVDGFPQDFTGAFMTDGSMYVLAGSAVTAGDAVYWTGTEYTATATDNDAIPNAVFDTSGADGDIVEISLKHRS